MVSRKVEHHDFDHPSFWFVMEDKIKSLFGGSLFYGPDVKSLGLKGEENVLDFGCGGGLSSRLIVKSLNSKGHLMGVDTSAYWINIAARRLKKYPNAEFRAGDIRRMNIPENSMDAILAIHVIHHIGPEDLLPVVTVLSRLLKKNGQFWVRERTQASHGISPAEIRTEFANTGLHEASYSLTGSEYRGKFVRDSSG